MHLYTNILLHVLINFCSNYSNHRHETHLIIVTSNHILILFLIPALNGDLILLSKTVKILTV